MSTSRVSVIVLNWNRADDTVACVHSLRSLRYPAREIIVVDNGSTAQCRDQIREALPDVRLLENGANLGFAEGNNVGIRDAVARGAQAVLLLNNDTTVDPDLLTALTKAAEAEPSAGFLGARIFYHSEPTRIWMGKPVWDPIHCRFVHEELNTLADPLHPPGVSEAAYACGCALMVTRRALDSVGLMDPRFFCYFEEVDWCFRGARQGIKSLYVPAAIVWHKVSATSGGNLSPLIRYYRARNCMLWAERNLLPWQRWRVFHNLIASTFGGLGWQEARVNDRLQRVYWNFLTICRDPGMRACRRGLWDYFCRRFGDAPASVKRMVPPPAVK